MDKNHGRLEQRRIKTTTALNDYLDFPHLGQVCLVERETIFTRTGERRYEQAFALTSQSPQQVSAERLLAQLRGHWAIENRSHHVRDVCFDEDRCQIRKGNGPRVMASLRNLAISLLRQIGFKNIKRATRQFAASARETLALLGL